MIVIFGKPYSFFPESVLFFSLTISSVAYATFKNMQEIKNVLNILFFS